MIVRSTQIPNSTWAFPANSYIFGSNDALTLTQFSNWWYVGTVENDEISDVVVPVQVTQIGANVERVCNFSIQKSALDPTVFPNLFN